MGDSTDDVKSTSSCVHSLRISSLSDGPPHPATSVSPPEVRRRVSPVLREPPPDHVQEHCDLSDSIPRCWTTPARLDVAASSLSDDIDDEQVPTSRAFQMRRTSSVENVDLLRRFTSSTAREFDDSATDPPRRSTYDPDRAQMTRSYDDLLACADAARRGDVGRTDLELGMSGNGAPASNMQCVSVIAWHRPRPRAPISGNRRRTRAALQNNGMYQHVADVCDSPRTVEIEIARHKPEM